MWENSHEITPFCFGWASTNPSLTLLSGKMVVVLEEVVDEEEVEEVDDEVEDKDKWTRKSFIS